jgi:hypothetical protein
MGNEDERHRVGGVELDYEGADLIAGDGIQRGKGFIQEDQLRP